MAETIKAIEPFRFYTRLHLSELTGLKAATLSELLELIKTVSGASIYHHTHRFLQQHQHLSPEPPNDFAYWVSNVLGERELGELLASIDIIQFTSVRALRERIVTVIEEYLNKHPSSKNKFVNPGAEFHFIKSNSFIFPTNHVAGDLKGLADNLRKVTIDSIYYHIFEARLRLEKGENDLSLWIEKEVGDKALAEKLSRLDPYTFTLEALRKKLVNLVEKSMS
ncbi:MAG: hypothetical protein JW749_11645 [Sedimentisphaerales bacterium]|nr:hypothetical protein [Sedimentisphaerales bacterium]